MSSLSSFGGEDKNIFTSLDNLQNKFVSPVNPFTAITFHVLSSFDVQRVQFIVTSLYHIYIWNPMVCSTITLPIHLQIVIFGSKSHAYLVSAHTNELDRPSSFDECNAVSSPGHTFMSFMTCCCHSCYFKKHKLTIFHTFSLSYRYLFFLVEMELNLMTDVPSVDPQATMSFRVWFQPLCVVISGQAMWAVTTPSTSQLVPRVGKLPPQCALGPQSEILLVLFPCVSWLFYFS